MVSKSAALYSRDYPYNHPLRGELPPSAAAHYVVHRYGAAADTTRVLDVGCGEGRNTLHLLAHGFRVTAVDASPANLRVLREAVASRGLDAERLGTCCGDFLAAGLVPPLSHDIALDVWVSGSVILPHDGRSGLVAFFRRLHTALIVNGLLLSEFETWRPRRQPEALLRYFANATHGLFDIEHSEAEPLDYLPFIDQRLRLRSATAEPQGLFVVARKKDAAP